MTIDLAEVTDDGLGDIPDIRRDESVLFRRDKPVEIDTVIDIERIPALIRLLLVEFLADEIGKIGMHLQFPVVPLDYFDIDTGRFLEAIRSLIDQFGFSHFQGGQTCCGTGNDHDGLANTQPPSDV
jgi:hypothetical protein